jgi:N-methylhydantoinase B
VQELARKYGVKRFRELIDGTLDYNERWIRSRIKELPEGSWSFEDQLDDDAHVPGPVPLKVKLTIKHKPKAHMVFDFAGSSAQRTGGVNCVYEALFATVAYALKATLDPELWSNAAFERVVRIEAPEGSIVNPRAPAPTGGRGTTCQRLADLLLGALSKVVEDRVTACGHGTTTVNLHGHDPIRGRRYICIDGLGGGMGGRAGHDGMDAVQINTNNIPNLPTEVLESEYPIRIDRYELVPDSGGAGEFRGGTATRKDFRMLADTGFIAHADRHLFQPWALGGGKPGSLGLHERNPHGEMQKLQSKGGPLEFNAGEVLRCQTAGAGGFGDPAKRTVERLAVDLADGKVTEPAARRDYPGPLVDAALQLAAKL